MNRNAANLIDVQWVAQCARRLRERWPGADVESLEETARELWKDDGLRGLGGEQAAAQWLAPVRRNDTHQSPSRANRPYGSEG